MWGDLVRKLEEKKVIEIIGYVTNDEQSKIDSHVKNFN